MPTRVKTCSQCMGPTQAHPQKVSLDPKPWSTLKLVDQYGASFLWLAPLLYPHKSVQQRLKVIHTTILVQAPKPLRARNLGERSPSTPPDSKACCQMLGPTCFQNGQLDSAATSPILVFVWPHLPTGTFMLPTLQRSCYII